MKDGDNLGRYVITGDVMLSLIVGRVVCFRDARAAAAASRRGVE